MCRRGHRGATGATGAIGPTGADGSGGGGGTGPPGSIQIITEPGVIAGSKAFVFNVETVVDAASVYIESDKTAVLVANDFSGSSERLRIDVDRVYANLSTIATPENTDPNYYFFTTGGGNTSYGTLSLPVGATGLFNSAFGIFSLANSTGITAAGNSAFGAFSLYSNTRMVT